MPNEKKYIDADELKKIFGEQRLDHDFCIRYDESTARDLIDGCPAADVEEVRHGRWIPVADGEMPECSECGECYDTEPDTFEEFCENYKYCPHCGAEMS